MDATSAQIDSDQSIVGATLVETASPPSNAQGTGANVGSSPGNCPVAPQRKSMAEDVHDAFLLGWSVAELIGRVQVPIVAPVPGEVSEQTGPDFLPFVTVASDLFWVVSMWRVNFERISQLTIRLFPESSTLNTQWDPGDSQPAYLYPAKPKDDPLFVDYADIGSVREPDGHPTLPDFRLREATRRALNCLALLKLSAQGSLLPEVLTLQQQLLVQAVLGVPLNTADSDSGEPVPVPADTLSKAAEQITAKLLLFLHAWEGYLRESVYASGATARNETQLVAFEAGRSMAALSWGISVDVLTGKSPAVVWAAAFSDANVSRLQHQLAVLGQAVGGDVGLGPASPQWAPTASAPEDEENVPAADALAVVARSLDYWQRATQWLINAEATDAQWDQVRSALIEQTGVWQALCMGQVDVSAYTSPGVIQRILQDVVVSFENLAVQQGLIGASEQVANEAAELAKQAAAEVQRLEEQLEAISTSVAVSIRRQIVGIVFGAWPILVLGLLAIVALSVVLLRFSQTGSGNNSDVTAAAIAVLGALGLWGTHSQSRALTSALGLSPGLASAAPDAAAVTVATASADPTHAEAAPLSLTARLGSMFGRAGDSIMGDFEKGFGQVQRDLRYLSRTVAVTYPLAEYFILDSHIVNVDEPFEFVERVVWNKDEQKQEVMRVAYAAFGAIGSFAMARLFSSGKAPTITEAAVNAAASPPTPVGDAKGD